MKAKIKVDSRKMRSALRSYSKVLKRRTIPEILNTKTPFIITRAMRLTPKTAASRITAELGSTSSPNGLAIAIVRSRAKANGKRLTMAEAINAARKMIRARRAAVRYVSLGWLKALASWRSVSRPLKSSSLAAKGGYGIRATTFRHETRFANTAPGAFEGEDALQQAMNAEARSTAAYAAKRLSQASRRFKGRR